jgi:hypothetical protein
MQRLNAVSWMRCLRRALVPHPAPERNSLIENGGPVSRGEALADEQPEQATAVQAERSVLLVEIAADVNERREHGVRQRAMHG